VSDRSSLWCQSGEKRLETLLADADALLLISVPHGLAFIVLAEDCALTRNLSNGLTALANSNTSNDQNQQKTNKHEIPLCVKR
jgi:hypothetical protein